MMYYLAFGFMFMLQNDIANPDIQFRREEVCFHKAICLYKDKPRISHVEEFLEFASKERLGRQAITRIRHSVLSMVSY